MRLMFAFRNFIPLFANRNCTFNAEYRYLNVRHDSSKSQTDSKVLKGPKSPSIDTKHIELLQKLSFVEFTNAEGVEIVENAIKFADSILEINTENVEPMYTVLENRNLTLREDVVTDGNCKNDVLKNSSVTEDEYFVVPYGSSNDRKQVNNDKKCNRRRLQRAFFNLSLTESGALQKYVFNESGNLLRNHFYKEWLLSTKSNLLKKDVYIYKNGAGAIQDNSQVWSEILKKLGSKHDQFGIVQAWNSVTQNTGMKADDYNYYLSPEEITNYHFIRILPHSEGNYYFFHWQRQRKMWWSKITSTPGLFALTDAETAENMKTVHIQAQFPWGKHITETICFNFDKAFSDKYARVTSLVKLEPAVVSIFCDAMKDPDTVRFHRKIAPYKFSFALLVKDPKEKERLAKLAHYIQSMLCKDNVSTIMPDSFEPPLRDQFKQNCALGIPYTVVVDGKSLETGILRLMSRDTTLMEQVHLADLRKYTCMLLKNL